jgi:hypothetical protein
MVAAMVWWMNLSLRDLTDADGVVMRFPIREMDRRRCQLDSFPLLSPSLSYYDALLVTYHQELDL